jgi:hypothetical protein
MSDTWAQLATLLFGVRMVAVLVALIRTDLPGYSRVFIGWFGPRGIGTVVLGLLVIERGDIEHADLLTQAGVIAVTLSHVHTPLVFGAAHCGDPIDDDLPLADPDIASVEEAGGEELEEQPGIAGKDCEQHQRGIAAHDRVDRVLDVCRKRLRPGGDPAAMIFIA